MERALLIKYIKGNCSEQEKAEVVGWLESSSEHMKEYATLRKLYDIAIWQMLPIPIPKRRSKHHHFFRVLKPLYKEVLKIAAIFVVALVFYHYIFSTPNNDNALTMQSMYVPAGQHAQVTLADGTIVWLNAKTTLTFPNHFSGSTREVYLDGEGFFEVSSDKFKPFIVKTSLYNVKVLGTTFNLLAYSGNRIFETSLLEGSVEILQEGSCKITKLRPNERAFLMDNQLMVDRISHANYFLWKEGIISFEDESFPELINKLELYFDMKISVQNNDIMSYRCTGKFRTIDGIEHILKVLQLSNHFSYTISEKSNTITIK